VDALTRRQFLLRSGVAGGAAIVAGATGLTIWDLLATAGTRPADVKTLVVVTLYGGNDGLATVIPYADPAYHDNRADLAYAPEQVLKLDDQTGLNPGLKGLSTLYSRKQLAIVRGVGYPKPDHSHFRSMDIWQTADPVHPTTSGWLGRWLDGMGGDPRLAVSFEPVLPLLLAGEKTAGASVAVGASTTVTTAAAQTITALGQPSAGEPVLQARAARCFADLLEVDAMITKVKQVEAATAAGATDQDTPQATSTGGAQTALASQLELVAECVEARVATRVFSVSLGGFDFHADERDAQERLLGQLDTALTGFVNRLGKTDAGRDVVTMVYSEFGRRVKANASDGTDHGTASDMFVLGPHVSGGRFIDDQPSLTDLDDGDLKFNRDFRDIYATMLADVLGSDPAPILSGWSGRVDGLFG
jgi:uncharacterized protein (DUF1501 family)